MIIRWVCEKCSKKWVYPVEKCIYCKGSITKQRGTKIKVVGFTKVMIPSPMHPIIPYNIALLEDEFGNKMPKKTMKEYRIGEDYNEQKAKTKDAVAVVKIKYDIEEAIKEAIELVNGVGLEPDDQVLIKPSIIAAAYPYQAVNTNPDFLDALLKVLYGIGLRKENIIVGEQALIGSDSLDAASKSGILGVCKKHGINFVDISKGPFEEIEYGGFKFGIFKEALNRKIINVPIMKTNFQIVLSGAVENLSRLADEKTQRRIYSDGVDNTLPKLEKALKNVFTVSDASNGLQGQGPLSLGEPAFLNFTMASRNATALDRAFCEIAMLDIPPYIDESTSLEVVGYEIDAMRYPIKKPVPDETSHPDIKVIDGGACPACLNMMYNLTSKLVGLRGQQINIVMGTMLTMEMLKGKKRLVVIGDCAIGKIDEMGIGITAKINENLDFVEQVVLMKKLLTTEGKPVITPVDKVKSKMKNFLSKVAR